jgi:hypothetical protein
VKFSFELFELLPRFFCLLELISWTCPSSGWAAIGITANGSDVAHSLEIDNRLIVHEVLHIFTFKMNACIYWLTSSMMVHVSDICSFRVIVFTECLLTYA